MAQRVQPAPRAPRLGRVACCDNNKADSASSIRQTRHVFSGTSDVPPGHTDIESRRNSLRPRPRESARDTVRRVEATNIGFAVYKKGGEPGTLDARWTYENRWSGPGLATGGPEHGFAGEYHIRYYLDSGEFSDEYDLRIERTGDVYELQWLTGNEVSAIGVGMEVGDRLAVGWRRLTD